MKPFTVKARHYTQYFSTFERAVIAAHARIVSGDSEYAEIWSRHICRAYYCQYPNGPVLSQ